MNSLQQAVAAGLSFGRFKRPSPGAEEDADSFDEASVCDLDVTRRSQSKHRLSQPPSRCSRSELPRDQPLSVLSAIEALAAQERYSYMPNAPLSLCARTSGLTWNENRIHRALILFP